MERPGLDAARLLDASIPPPSAIDYYGQLEQERRRSGSATAIFGFRIQAFVTRAPIAGLTGVRSGRRVGGIWTGDGREAAWPCEADETGARRESAPPARRSMSPPILRLDRIRKEFGAVVAVEDVTLDVQAGEILALVGDNGAGKSTLVKMIAGVYPPSSGDIVIEGEPVRFSGPTMPATTGSRSSSRTSPWRTPSPSI